MDKCFKLQINKSKQLYIGNYLQNNVFHYTEDEFLDEKIIEALETHFLAIFDMKTGKVTGISNNPDPTSTHVEISRELYSKFVNVEEDINNYIVINENKKYQIIKKGKEFVEEVANENVIPLKKFFKLQDSMNIFQIVQDNERWYAYGKFTDDYMKYLITNPNLFARDRILYLTEKNDARKLLETCQSTQSLLITVFLV